MPKPTHKPAAAKKHARVPYKKIFFWLCIVSMPLIIIQVIHTDLKVANWPRTTGTIVTIKDAGTRYVNNYNATATYNVNNKVYSPTSPKAIPYYIPKGNSATVAYNPNNPNDFIFPAQHTGDETFARFSEYAAGVFLVVFLTILAFALRPVKQVPIAPKKHTAAKR